MFEEYNVNYLLYELHECRICEERINWMFQCLCYCQIFQVYLQSLIMFYVSCHRVVCAAQTLRVLHKALFLAYLYRVNHS